MRNWKDEIERNQEMKSNSKNRCTPFWAYFLWFFFGWAGIHRFYLGHYISGMMMLVLTLSGILTLYPHLIGAGLISLWLVFWVFDIYFINTALMKYDNEGQFAEIGSSDQKKNTNFFKFVYFLRFFLVCLILGGMSYFAYKMWRNYQGYCYEESRYLSEKELIETAVNRALLDEKNILEKRWQNLSNQGIEFSAQDPFFRSQYQTTGEFLQANPNCCELQKISGSSSWSRYRFFGAYRAHTKVPLPLFDEKGNEVIDDIGPFFYVLSNCGEARRLNELD